LTVRSFSFSSVKRKKTFLPGEGFPPFREAFYCGDQCFSSTPFPQTVSIAWAVLPSKVANSLPPNTHRGFGVGAFLNIFALFYVDGRSSGSTFRRLQIKISFPHSGNDAPSPFADMTGSFALTTTTRLLFYVSLIFYALSSFLTGERRLFVPGTSDVRPEGNFFNVRFF